MAIKRSDRLRSAAVLAAMVLATWSGRAAAAWQPTEQGASASASQAATAGLEERLARLCEKLETRRVDQHIPSMAIAIVKDDKVVLARGFGLRDIEAKAPAEATTMYAIGSQTKAFTSMLVSMLADEGKLSWDEPVRTHVPGFHLFDKSADESVTLRDLCSHRTGLPRTDLLWAGGKASKQQMMERLAFAEPTFKFREKWQYNNTMFMVAGMAAESAGGASWQDLIRTRIFEPLGMKSSNTHIRDMLANPQAAKGYKWDNDRQEHRPTPMREVTCDGAGAINSTVLDMAQWLRMLLGRGEFEGKRLVSEEKLGTMWTKQIDMAPGAGYGLGWMLSEWNGKKQVDHGGNIDGFFCACGMLPEERLGVVLLGALTYAPIQGEVLPLVWQTFFPPAETADAPFTQDQLQEYLGKYKAELLGIDCTVNLKDGKLYFEVPGQTNYELNWPDKDGRWAFTMMPQAIQLKFNRNSGGRVVSVTSYQGGLELVCPRLGDDGQPVEAPPAPPPPMFTRDELKEFTGTYHFGPTNDEWKVIIRKDTLGVDVPRQRVFDLQWPDDQGRWKVAIAPNAMSCRFNRGEDGKVKSMTWIQGGELEMPRSGDVSQTLPPTLDEICSLRNASANPDRIREMGDVEFTGKVRCINQGIEGTVVARANADGRIYQDIDLGIFGFIRAAYDGEHGWSHSVGEDYNELAGEQLDELRKSGSQYLITDLRTLFDSIEVQDTSKLDGKDVIIVTGRSKKPEKTVKQYLDARTGLPLKEETSLIVPTIGQIPMTVVYGDYMDVEGVQFPTSIRISNDASGTMLLTVEKITPRAKLGPDAYRLPAPAPATN